MADNNNSNGGLIAIVIILVGVIIIGAVYFFNGTFNQGDNVNITVPDTVESVTEGGAE